MILPLYIQEYLLLQFRMMNRKIIDFGLKPFPGYLLIVAVFVLFSLLLFNRTDLAGYIYVLAGLSALTGLSEVKRNDFLRTYFSGNQYVCLRLTENGLVILPFAIGLLICFEYIPLLSLVTGAILFARMNIRASYSITIPTPFTKQPFEFLTGFRRSYLLLIFSYFLLVMSVIYSNYNLGVFALLFQFLIFLSFYAQPENEFFVWIHNLTPGRFLMRKILKSLLHSTMISFPVFIALTLAFPAETLWTSIFLLMGYTALITMILTKYAAYPKQINLPQTILLVIGIYFPFLMLGIIPYFYRQSIRKLNEYL